MSRPLTWAEKVFIKTMRVAGDLGMGYHIDFDEELVRQHGVSGFIQRSKRLYALQTELEEKLGHEHMHLVAAFASFANGCDYCTWGHLFALNLLHFEKTGELYPIDERETFELMKKRDAEVEALLTTRLAAFPEHLRLLKRQAELRNGAQAQSEEDRVIDLAKALFEWVNECSITVDAPAPPLGAVAKKKDLLKRYEAARAPLRGGSPMPTKG